MKKITNVIMTTMILLMMLNGIVSLKSYALTDFRDDDEIVDERIADTLIKLNIMKGTENGFEGEKTVTKAEMAQIMFNVLEQNGYNFNQVNTSSAPVLTDLKPDAWYNNCVTALTGAGIISGNGYGKFEPEKEISSVEASVMISRTLLPQKAVSNLKYPDDYIEIGKKANNAIENISDFLPDDYSTPINREIAGKLVLGNIVVAEEYHDRENLESLETLNNGTLAKALKENLIKNEEKDETQNENESKSSKYIAIYANDGRTILLAEDTLTTMPDFKQYNIDDKTIITIEGNHGGRIALDDLGRTIIATKVDATITYNHTNSMIGGYVNSITFKKSADVMRKSYKKNAFVVGTGKTTDENYEVSYDLILSDSEESYYSEDEDYEVGDLIRAYVTSDVMTSSEKVEYENIYGHIYKFNDEETMKVLIYEVTNGLNDFYEAGQKVVLDLKDDVLFIEQTEDGYEIAKEKDIETIGDSVSIADEVIDGDFVEIYLAPNEETDDLEVYAIVKMLAE